MTLSQAPASSLEIAKTETKQHVKSDEIHHNEYTVIDIESTDFFSYTKESKIIEIAAVKVKDQLIVEEFKVFLKGWEFEELQANVHHPWFKMHPDVAEPLLIEALRDGIHVKDAINNLQEFVGDDVIVGHNIAHFDLPFLSHVAQKSGLDSFHSYKYVDTLHVAKRKDLSLSSYSLDDLASYYNLPMDVLHEALEDARLNAVVYEALKESPEKTSKLTSSESVSPWIGKKVAVTGEFSNYTRQGIQLVLEKLGAEVIPNISTKTDLLIVGETGYSPEQSIKYLKAKQNHVPIIMEHEFYAMV